MELGDAFVMETEANRRHNSFARKADMKRQSDVVALSRAAPRGETGYLNGPVELLTAAGPSHRASNRQPPSEPGGAKCDHAHSRQAQGIVAETLTRRVGDLQSKGHPAAHNPPRRRWNGAP